MPESTSQKRIYAGQRAASTDARGITSNDRQMPIVARSRCPRGETMSEYDCRFVPIGHGFDIDSVDPLDRPNWFHSSIETRCSVYRFFNPAGALLYVGVANDHEARSRQHAEDSEWWEQWAWYTVAWYPNRTWAIAVESHAIVAEYPAYNVAGRPDETNYPWGEPADDQWDYNEQYDGFTLNLLYGQWRRSETLARYAPRRQWVHPETAEARYRSAMKQSAWYSRYWHDTWLGNFKARERVGHELLESRLHARGHAIEAKGASIRPRRKAPAGAAGSDFRATGGGGNGPKVRRKVPR